VKADFFKNAKATFAPEQMWRIPGVQIPDNGRAVVFNQDHDLENHTIRLIALTGPGKFKISNEIVVAMSPWVAGMPARSSSSSTTVLNGQRTVVNEFTTQEPALLLSVSDLQDVDQFLVRYRDQSGRVGAAEFRGGADHQYQFSFSNLRNVTALDLELIIQQPIPVEFTVAPPKPPSSASGSGEGR
jgi:hypothetical protein